MHGATRDLFMEQVIQPGIYLWNGQRNQGSIYGTGNMAHGGGKELWPSGHGTQAAVATGGSGSVLPRSSKLYFFALSRHRRRRVRCAGMDAPALKTTASPRQSF